MRVFCGGVSALLIALVPSASVGQRLVEVQDPKLPPAIVVLEWTTSLPDSDFSPRFGVAPAQGAHGRWYIARQGGVRIYDRFGKQIDKFGRHGRGPGEFSESPRIFIDPRDTVYALDGYRLTIFSPTRLVVRTQALPIRADLSAVQLAKGVFVVPATTAKQSTFPGVLKLLDERGRVHRTFAELDLAPGYESRPRSYLTASRRGRVWTWGRNAYRIEQWDTAGKLVQVVHRTAPWFKEWSTPPVELPILLSVREDSAGRLWTLSAIARDDARHIPKSRAIGPPEASAEQNGKGDMDYAYIVEVIDVNSGQLLASSQLIPFVAAQLLEANTLLVQRDSPDGLVFLDFWLLSLPHGRKQ